MTLEEGISKTYNWIKQQIDNEQDRELRATENENNLVAV